MHPIQGGGELLCCDGPCMRAFHLDWFVFSRSSSMAYVCWMSCFRFLDCNFLCYRLRSLATKFRSHGNTFILTALIWSMFPVDTPGFAATATRAWFEKLSLATETNLKLTMPCASWYWNLSWQHKADVNAEPHSHASLSTNTIHTTLASVLRLQPLRRRWEFGFLRT